MDPTSPAATKMLSLLRYVDLGPGDDATYEAMSQAAHGRSSCCSIIWRCLVPRADRPGHWRAAWCRGDGALFGADLASSRQLNETMHQYFPEEAIFRVDDCWPEPRRNVLFRPVCER
jgi:glucose-6-phosphate 1-dehydrogenase